MKCIHCGTELPEGAKFCFKCGGKQLEQDVKEEKESIQIPVQEEAEENQAEFQGEDMPEERAEEETPQEVSEEEPLQEAIEEEPPQEAPEKEAQQEEDHPEPDDKEKSTGRKFCPYCGAQNDGDAVFCFSCGKNMTAMGGKDTGKNNHIPKRKIPVKFLAGGIVIIGVAAAAIGIIGSLLDSGNDNYVVYLKDNRVNQTDLSHYKGEPVEYSAKYGSDDIYASYTATVQYSEDGKYIFYPTELESGAEGLNYRLNMQKVGKSEDPVRIDNSVSSYTVLDDNRVAYIKAGNNTLYINDRKDNKEKISSDVIAYYVDDDQKNIVCVQTTSDGGYSVYQQPLNLKQDKKELADDVDSYNIVAGDLDQITVMTDDVLYLIRNFGEKEKISSGVNYVTTNNTETDTVYYVKEAETPVMAADLVEDDCAEADAAMQEPVYDNYQTEKVQKNDATNQYEKVSVTDYEAYDEAYAQYQAKLNRDEMRESLGNYEISNQLRELYCYKDGKEVKVDGAFTGAISYDDAESIIFNRYNLENIPKIKLSEISSAGEVESRYYESLEDSAETCIYSGNEVIVLNEVLDSGFTVDEDGKIGYGIKIGTTLTNSEDGDASESYTEETGESTLYSFALEGNSAGKCTVVAENVESIERVKDGDVYYLTDMENESGELYCNDEDVDSDVKTGSLTFKDGVVFYAVDYDSVKSRATLKMYNGKTDVTIADDVFSYKVFDKKNVVMLIDYSVSSYEGDLKYYRGKDDLEDIDNNVNFIFGGKMI